jgi:hypothetical protein
LTGGRIILHGVRHGYPTAVRAADEPSKVVSERLGRVSTSITANPIGTFRRRWASAGP